jgi:hypothetical protein
MKFLTIGGASLGVTWSISLFWRQLKNVGRRTNFSEYACVLAHVCTRTPQTHKNDQSSFNEVEITMRAVMVQQPPHSWASALSFFCLPLSLSIPVNWVTYSVGYSVMNAVKSCRVGVTNPGDLCQAVVSFSLTMNTTLLNYRHLANFTQLQAL